MMCFQPIGRIISMTGSIHYTIVTIPQYDANNNEVYTSLQIQYINAERYTVAMLLYYILEQNQQSIL